eukprot:NODE_5760_length_912_cov_68.423321_g5535_i0.p1 GENE.NODE_5760_length_912_cov_68.423321_g5535_i0~~NODE_5760_length_912_cov_68.423321_g5535_i0.p1  ORF type:complete len:238 (+),score=24.14 NODE_5760_length_912_cov_68.423321_g5535_i0:96-809(+)
MAAKLLHQFDQELAAASQEIEALSATLRKFTDEQYRKMAVMNIRDEFQAEVNAEGHLKKCKALLEKLKSHEDSDSDQAAKKQAACVDVQRQLSEHLVRLTRAVGAHRRRMDRDEWTFHTFQNEGEFQTFEKQYDRRENTLATVINVTLMLTLSCCLGWWYKPEFRWLPTVACISMGVCCLASVLVWRFISKHKKTILQVRGPDKSVQRAESWQVSVLGARKHKMAMPRKPRPLAQLS